MNTYLEDTFCMVWEERCQVFWMELQKAVYQEEQQDTELEKHGNCIHEGALLEPPYCNYRHQYYNRRSRNIKLTE